MCFRLPSHFDDQNRGGIRRQSQVQILFNRSDGRVVHQFHCRRKNARAQHIVDGSRRAFFASRGDDEKSSGASDEVCRFAQEMDEANTLGLAFG